MIWINGAFADSPKQLSVTDKINLGMTVFTTMLGHKKVTGNIVLNKGRAHYARLCRHAAVLGLRVPFSEDEILEAAAHLVKTQHGVFFAVRIQVTAGDGARGLGFPDTPTVFMTLSEIGNPEEAQPVRVKIDRTTVFFAADPMNRIKSNYALRAVAKRQAIAEGFDDVLLMNDMNAVTSSSVGNIILKIEDVYKTPPLHDGVVDGIRRAELLKTMEIRESSLSEADFRFCDAAWIVNSLGIRPIICIDTIQKPVERLI